jgi:hypothetical protein
VLGQAGVTQRHWVGVFLLIFAAFSFAAKADDFNGRADHQVDRIGYYHVLTTDQGEDVDGGNVFRFVTDDPDWDIPIDEWQDKPWFRDNRGLALTFWREGQVIWQNHGIETKQTGTFFQAAADTSGALSTFTPGLTSFFSMSNNYDMIYAGYFKLDRPITFDQISGYFACVGGFPPNHPRVSYRMNIWSVKRENGTLMPAEQSFTGDVFTTDDRRGNFEFSETGVTREWTRLTDGAEKVWRLTYAPEEAVTLPAGEYFFSHDAVLHEGIAAIYFSPVAALPLLLAGAPGDHGFNFFWLPFSHSGGRGYIPPGKTVVPEPATGALMGIGLAGFSGVAWLRRRRRRK